MRRPFITYATALAALAAAVLLRWLLDPWMGDTLPLVTLFGAVAVAVWIGGYRPALLVAVLGYFSCAYLFIEPRGTLGSYRIAILIGLLAYVVTCSIIIGFGTSMRNAQRRAETRREALRTTLASIGDAVITTDPEGRITSLNAAAASLTGWTQDEATGRSLDRVFRLVDEPTRHAVGLANETLLIAKDGTQRPIDDSAAPIRDQEGRLAGRVLVFRDTTLRRQGERALRESEERLRMALSAARSVAWEIDPSTGRLALSDIAADVLGLAPGSTLEHVEQGFALVHRDDVERHRAIVGKAVEECGTYRSQYRILRQDTGELQWMEERGNGIREHPGEPVRLIGVVTDISDRKQREEQLRRSAELLTFLIDRSPTGFYIVDADFRISHINADSQARAFRNVSPAIGRRLDEAMRILWPEPLATEIIRIFRHTLETGEPYRSPGLVSPRNDLDAVETYEWQLDRISLPDGTYGVVCYYYDTTRLREAEQQLRESEAQLRTSTEQLREADRRKDEFLATLAHELRNPLAPISNALSALKLATHDPESLEQARSMMERQLGQMVRLVDDLLDVSRISRDRLQLRLGKVELASILYQAVETCRPQAESNHLELTVTLPSQPVHLTGDPVRLAQVFSNLLNNSCKFTKAGGSIRLAAELEGSDVAVVVRDDGIGIPPDKLDSVFEMFVQVDNSLERSQGGLGLGLTLVKRIVELHGGRIEAHSDGLGLGSEFVVRLPVVNEKPQSLPPEGGGETPPATSRRRILVVDDNRDSADTLARLLDLSGNETHVAYDGQQAVEAAVELRPEVILLDIGLPKLNGYDACRAIRGFPWGSNVVVIALSGWGQEEDKRKSTEAGFDGHLVKPVDQKALMKLLAYVGTDMGRQPSRTRAAGPQPT